MTCKQHGWSGDISSDYWDGMVSEWPPSYTQYYYYWVTGIAIILLASHDHLAYSAHWQRVGVTAHIRLHNVHVINIQTIIKAKFAN